MEAVPMGVCFEGYPFLWRYLKGNPKGNQPFLGVQIRYIYIYIQN